MSSTPIIKRLKNEDISDSETIAVMKNLCSVFHIQSSAVCIGAIDNMKAEVMTVLRENDLSPEKVCSIIPNFQEHCFQDISPWNKIKWSIEVDSKSVQELENLKNRNFKKVHPLKILHLSDAHIDLDYLAGSSAFCHAPLCCRKEISSSRGYYLRRKLAAATEFNRRKSNRKLTAGYWITPESNACDVPLRFIHATFQHIAQTHGSDLDLIYWTGDLPPHNVWEDEKTAKHYELLSILGDLFYQYFPKIPVHYSIGNHENVPVNSFPLEGKTVKLYTQMAEALQKNTQLQPAALATFKNHGYYSHVISDKNLKIISLNTNLCNNQNFWLMDEKFLVDPDGSLTFLRDHLAAAETAHLKVHILGHIAPGSSPDCLNQWSAAYNKIIRRYLASGVITGQFFGHEHKDVFQLIWPAEKYEKSKTRSQHPTKTVKFRSKKYQFDPTEVAPIEALWLAPSLTTYDGGLPAYRVIQTDENNEIADFSTFLVDNYQEKDKIPTWKEEYRLSDKLKYIQQKLLENSPRNLEEISKLRSDFS